jgi:hypothetical protein
MAQQAGAKRGTAMREQAIVSQINRLASEEHEIWQRESHGQATKADRARLQRIETTLDRCWDLLNQRRARRAGRLKSEAPEGQAEEVEGGLE